MLQDIPFDVLIRICSHLDLSHVLSFVSVCSSLRQLADSRFLWIDVLERTAKARNLACPIGTDLSQMTIGGLRRVARHTNKLERNWGLERPRIARSVRITQYSHMENEEPATILAAIPTTPFVVLYLRKQEQILICDSNGQMPLQRIYVGVIRRRAHFDDSGNHLIAAIVVRDRILLKVISIEYEAGEILSVRELLLTDPPSQYLNGCLFVAPNLVGLRCDGDDGRSFIHIMDFTQKLSVEVPIVPVELANNPSISFSVVNKRLFIIIVWNDDDTGHETYNIYRCPVDKLSSGENPSWTEPAIELAARLVISDLSEGLDTEIIESKLSPFGFHNLRVVNTEVLAGITYASFWPLDQIHTRTPRSIEYGEEIKMEGKVGSHHYDYSAPWLLASSHSGIYSVLVMYHADQSPQLCLLQWDSDPPVIHIRTLDVPCYIDLAEIYSVAIEDRYGVVYLSHAQGHLLALPYA